MKATEQYFVVVLLIYRLTQSESEVSEYTCTISLTNNEKFQYRTRLCRVRYIENFEFIVSERVQVNPYNSRAISALTFLLFKLNTLHKEIAKRKKPLSQPKPWGNDSAVSNLHHGYYTAMMTSRRLFRHNPVSRGTNQPIRKSEFVQCMKVE